MKGGKPGRYVCASCYWHYQVRPDAVTISQGNEFQICETTFSEHFSDAYGPAIVTEIPIVDESSERELLSLLGDWYKPESFESIFSSIASDAVFFSF